MSDTAGTILSTLIVLLVACIFITVGIGGWRAGEFRGIRAGGPPLRRAQSPVVFAVVVAFDFAIGAGLLLFAIHNALTGVR